MKVITLNECLHYMESIGYRLDARGMGVFIFRQDNRLKGMLQTLHDSCREGEYGFWDGSKEGFASMAENVEDIATLLNLKIKETYTGVETNE